MDRPPRIRPRRAVVVLAVVGAVVTGTLAVAGATRPGEPPAAPAVAAEGVAAVPTASPAEIDQHVELRRIFALRHDRAHVEAVQHAPDTTVDAWLQLPVTPAEAAELARRESLVPKAEEMRAVLEQRGAFGGQWVESPMAQPQVMVVAIAGPVDDEVRRRILDIAGADPVRLVPVERTEGTLLDIGGSLAATPTGQAGHLTGWGTDVMANRVTASIDPGAPADTEAALVARFGDVFTFTREGPAVAVEGD